MTIVFFIAALIGGLGIVTCMLAQLILKNFQFWPPPDTASWQSRIFRLLFRLLVIGLIAVSALDYRSFATSATQFVIGLLLWAVGFGAAFYLTNFLGWRNAFGAEEGLKTNGAYAWSRNPIYVVSIIGIIGWGMAVASCYVWSILALWSSMYVVAPFVEEPWLKQRYGVAYQDYASKVRRFF